MNLIPALSSFGMLAVTGVAFAQVPARELTPGVLVKSKIPMVLRGEQHTLNVQSIPDSALRIPNWRGLAITRTPPASPGAIGASGGAAYVAKRWMDPPPSSPNDVCRQPWRGNDEIDLTEPRRHGFRLVSVSVIPLAAPAGYRSPEAPFRRGRNRDSAGRETSDPAQVVYIPLSARNYSLFTLGILPTPCFTGYRVELSLRGPAHIDPFTGRTIKRSQVN